MKFWNLYWSLIFLLFTLRLTFSTNNNTLLLIISFDGFRYDYFERNITETMLGLRKNSSYAPYIYSVFPSKTFPNHFSIATGLYAEVHGVLDNMLYDKLTNKTLSYGYELFHYNEDIVPIWTLNERGGEGQRSGCMMWPGSDLKYQQTLPSFFVSYNHSVSWHSRVDTVISWFTHPDTPINLGMMYFEEPDLACHSYGPESPEIDAQISRVDRLVQYLLTEAQQAGILDRLNIVLMSDHGGQAVSIPSNSIDLDDFIDSTLYIRDGVPPNLQIYPIPGEEKQVLEALRSARDEGGHFSTYSQEEMLERWRYKQCGRTPPIIVCADVGYIFSDQGDNGTTNDTVIGTHGYDPLTTSMRGFFMATGPNFKRNYAIKPFVNIHFYPLAAHILSLSLPSLRPNGSILTLQDILITTRSEHGHYTIYLVFGAVLGFVLMVSAIGVLLYRRYIHRPALIQRPSNASYRALNQNVDDKDLDIPLSDREEDMPT